MGIFSIILGIFFLFSCSRTNYGSKLYITKENVDVDSVTIIFSGDFMQHMPQVVAAKSDSGYNYDYSLTGISKLWKSSDFAIVNLETTLSKSVDYTGYPMFSSPSEIVSGLKQAGVDAVALANNHCCDKGSKGLSNTMQIIESKDLNYIGIGRDDGKTHITVLRKGNFRIAVLNYTYGTNGMPIPKGFQVNLIDTLTIKYTLNKIAQLPINKVIVFFHWGYEYQTKEHSQQIDLARWCIDNGVDYVVGSHPHVVQSIDTANRVVYSLGNLVSNQSARFQDGGISVKLTVFTDSIRCNFIPHWVDRDNKYKILLPCDTMNNRSAQFLKSLNDSRQIVGKVKEFSL